MSDSLEITRSDTQETVNQTALGILRATLAQVPIVGAFLNEAIEVRSRIAQGRINATVQLLSDAVASLDKDRIDRTYLRTEEFSDLVLDVLGRAARTSSERKRQLFARILLAGVTSNDRTDFELTFREFVEKLSEGEVWWLQWYATAQKIAQDHPNQTLPYTEPLLANAEAQKKILSSPKCRFRILAAVACCLTTATED